jgi:hypothetical protein
MQGHEDVTTSQNCHAWLANIKHMSGHEARPSVQGITSLQNADAKSPGKKHSKKESIEDINIIAIGPRVM